MKDKKFTIFKLSNEDLKGEYDSYEFIGFHAEPKNDLLLTLLAINHGVSKSSFLRSMVSDRVRTFDPVPSLARQVHLVWQLNRYTHSLSFIGFKTSLVKELTEKGIPEELITKIVREFDKLAKKK